MSTLFYGLNIAKNALFAQTHVLNVVSHNVANANTPGYSRQTVLLASIADSDTNQSIMLNEITVGSGVEAKFVARSRFGLYDAIYRKENQNYNSYAKTEELLNQVELLFDEPSDRGLSQIMNDFFNGWQDLANDPQNMAARQSLKSMGNELCDRFHRINDQLLTMRQDIDNEISAMPERINEISREIADLNSSIRVADSQGTSANDLRDKRDVLIDELSEYSDVRAVEQSDGTYTVIIGSKVIVEHDSVSELKAVSSTADQRNIKKTVITSEDGSQYSPTQGKIGALITFRDNVIEDIIDKFDKLAESIVRTVNFEHENGYSLTGETERSFFDPSHVKAFNISISDDINDVSYIAASGDGSKGDNANALRINDLRYLKLVESQFSFSEYYNATIADIGVMAREAKSGRQNEELLVTQIDNSREAIKGVSIDEELITMIQTQHIYQAASRLIVTIDAMLETLMAMK